MKWLPNLLGFVLGLVLAYTQGWQTRDLVWSLWLSSLVIGYATILVAIGSGMWMGRRVLSRDEVSNSVRVPGMIGGAFMGLFLLGFFSLHFCGFHAGHSVFLNSFFPLDSLGREGFGDAFMNPLALWKGVFTKLMGDYGLFLVCVFLVEWKNVLGPVLAVRANVETTKVSDLKQMARKEGGPDFMQNAMVGPYRNVVRMHLLIFFFAGAHAMKADSFLIYAVVYAVYFFPWSILKRQDNDEA